jgi:hypothetical protein
MWHPCFWLEGTWDISQGEFVDLGQDRVIDEVQIPLFTWPASGLGVTWSWVKHEATPGLTE